jgi:prevent-host-death family protein
MLLAKAKLSEYVEAAAAGEHVVICNRNRPVAELRSLDTSAAPRDLEPLFPDWDIAPDFFAPLPADEQDAWDGGAVEPRSHVAERTPKYGRAMARKRR